MSCSIHLSGLEIVIADKGKVPPRVSTISSGGIGQYEAGESGTNEPKDESWRLCSLWGAVIPSDKQLLAFNLTVEIRIINHRAA